MGDENMAAKRHNWTADLAGHEDLEELLAAIMFATKKDKSGVLVAALLKWADTEYPEAKRRALFDQVETLQRIVDDDSDDEQDNPKVTARH